ncbi:MAG TPA: hypothetical protein VFY14_03520 [Streptomyces sp.]|nr:hypothetical protein [Streptomyces sp.]
MTDHQGQRVVVLAGNLREFRAWCIDNGRSPHDPRVIYASSWHKLRGLTDVEIIRYGRWWNHPDMKRLEEAAQAIERRRP